MNTALSWSYDGKPHEPGWYAQTHCWEAEEGLFPGVARWDGENWKSTDPIFAFAGPFNTEVEAEQWAYDHDMGG